MKLIKFGHSCVRLERDGHVLVFDPGVFSDVPAALDGAHAVLITHEHPDHLDADALRAAAAADPALRIWAPATVAASLADLGDQVSTASPDSQFTAGGFDIATFGGQHAVIHPLLPVVPNVTFLVDGTVYHPGDSFTVPPVDVPVVLVPIHAPWSRISEVIDFVIAVRAPQAFPIHDGLLNDIGRGMVEGHVTRFGALFGSTYRHLDVNESVELA